MASTLIYFGPRPFLFCHEFQDVGGAGVPDDRRRHHLPYAARDAADDAVERGDVKSGWHETRREASEAAKTRPARTGTVDGSLLRARFVFATMGRSVPPAPDRTSTNRRGAPLTGLRAGRYVYDMGASR